MASRSGGVTRLYEAPQAPEPERLPQPTKTKDKVLLDERGLLDLPFLALTVLLVLIGVVMVFSASYARAYYLTGNSTYYFARQAIFAVVGIGGMLFVSRLNYQLWRSASFIILAVSVVFLMLVPLIGSTANGAKRWIEVAGIRFQPSELAKIAIIMTFSAMISTYRDKMRTFRYGIAPFGAIMIVLCGLVALERHFSCILIMLLLAAAMLFLGGVQLRYFVAGLAAIAVFAAIYLNTMGYAADRIRKPRAGILRPRRPYNRDSYDGQRWCASEDEARPGKRHAKCNRFPDGRKNEYASGGCRSHSQLVHQCLAG